VNHARPRPAAGKNSLSNEMGWIVAAGKLLIGGTVCPWSVLAYRHHVRPTVTAPSAGPKIVKLRTILIRNDFSEHCGSRLA
jgi:hypothetical protein